MNLIIWLQYFIYNLYNFHLEFMFDLSIDSITKNYLNFHDGKEGLNWYNVLLFLGNL
jgi:hypothetical protein